MKLSLIPYNNNLLADCVSLFRSNQGKYFSAEELAEYQSFLEGLKSNDYYYVVLGDDTIVGAGGIAEDDGHAVLTWGMVSRELHGQGIGDYLTSQRLIEIAKHYPDKAIQIETSQHTAGFYMRHGFHTISKQPDGYGANIDKYIMRSDPAVSDNKVIESQFQTDLILEGDTLLLEPLATNDLERLYEVASDPEIWALHPASDRYKREVFQGYFQSGIDSGMAYLIIDKVTRTVVGSSRYHAPDFTASSIEIGWTFLARSHWGGKTNAELKHLMIWHAFATFDKIHFCIGAANHRSIAAVKKLGAYYQPDIVDDARTGSVIYELTRETYVGQDNYGKSHE